MTVTKVFSSMPSAAAKYAASQRFSTCRAVSLLLVLSARAILVLLEAEKTVVEGAGAVGIAALLADKVPGDGPVAAPLCGGNIDVNRMAKIIERGMANDGRLVWLRSFTG